MAIFGISFVFIGLPLVIGYYIGEKKNSMWRNLGFITIAFGIILFFVR